jgi:ubiquinone/menaquinone biosynthesis C-methylase UbiE
LLCGLGMGDSLPDYAKRLDALHAALAGEFAAIVGQLPLVGREYVLDAGCGDGFFSRLIAERLNTGCVVALDSSPAYLDVVRARSSEQIAAGRIGAVEGDVNSLPLETGSVDVVWSAHSMQSYDDLPAVLAEFRRVLQPGGLLAVLETDSLHSIMLPWPPRLEMALRQAERQTLGDADDRMGAYFPRYASRLFRNAGFEEFSKRHTLVYRHAPLDATLREYVRLYLDSLLKHTRKLLDEATITEAGRLAALFGETLGEADPDLYFGSLQVLMTARNAGKNTDAPRQRPRPKSLR